MTIARIQEYVFGWVDDLVCGVAFDAVIMR